jgi:DNA-binding NarL/FixJ family response regulator
MTTRPLRAVVCDDDAAVRALLRAALTARGIEVAGESHDGHGCDELVRTHRPDVIVLDLGLPGVDGASNIGVVRAVDPAIGVVMYTGTDEPLLERRLLALGADRFIVKGTAPRKVAAIVEQTARAARARAGARPPTQVPGDGVRVP